MSLVKILQGVSSDDVVSLICPYLESGMMKVMPKSDSYFFLLVETCLLTEAPLTLSYNVKFQRMSFL